MISNHFAITEITRFQRNVYKQFSWSREAKLLKYLPTLLNMNRKKERRVLSSGDENKNQKQINTLAYLNTKIRQLNR